MIWIILICAAMFLLTLWRREIGVAATLLLLPSYLLRTKLFGVPTTALELAIYSVALACAIVTAIKKDFMWPRLPRWFLISIVVWVIAWTLSTLNSTDCQASLGAFKAWLIDPLLYGTLLLLYIRSTPQRALLLKSLVLSGTMVALAGFAQFIWWRDTLQDHRLSSFFHPVANYAAMFLAPILVVTVGAILWKILGRSWWAAVGVMFIALILTVSFGGYLSLIVGLAFLWWRWPSRRQRGMALMIAGAVFLFGVGVLSKTSYLAEKVTASDRSSSLVRTQIWRTSVEMIKDRPWFGVGPNAYENIYRETIPKLYWPPLEWLVSQPHQLFLALWLETGLLGLIIFMVFIVSWVIVLWKKTASGNIIATIAVAAMLAILAHGFVDTPLFKNDLMILFVVMAILPFLNIGEAPISKK